MKTSLRYTIIAALLALVLGMLGARWLGVNIAEGLFRFRPSPLNGGGFSTRFPLPPGFSISVYAADPPGAHVLRFTDSGDLLVSLPASGRIILLERDNDGDGQPDARHDLLTELNRPHGMDLHDGWLYVADTDAVGAAASMPKHAGLRVSTNESRVYRARRSPEPHGAVRARRPDVCDGGLQLQCAPRDRPAPRRHAAISAARW